MNTAHTFSLCILCTALAGLILSGCDESGSTSPFDDAPAEFGVWTPSECPTEADREGVRVTDSGVLTDDVVTTGPQWSVFLEDGSGVRKNWAGGIVIDDQTILSTDPEFGSVIWNDGPRPGAGECYGVTYGVVSESGNTVATGRVIVLGR